MFSFFNEDSIYVYRFIVKNYICDRLQENWAQHGVHKYREKIDRFLKMYCFKLMEGNN